MKKLISLLKATTKNSINLFRYNSNEKTSKLNKKILPIALTLIVMLSIGMYAYMIETNLPSEFRYIMLTIFIIFTSIVTFIEGIYKSQGILFDAKDNDLLFSLPIEKTKILFARIFKLLIFQYLYNMLFVLPAFIVYIAFQRPGIEFYLISLLMMVLLPVIPTVISCILGYAIKGISSKLKYKKIFQIAITMIVFIGIFFLSYNLESAMGKIAENAKSINDILIKLYYPAGLYINLIQNFKVVDLIILLAINIIPAILFIYLASISYFKIISNSAENSIKSSKKSSKQIKTKSKSQLKALINKETKRYFSSPIYIFNTSFGLILMLILTIGISVNLDGVINIIIKGENLDIEISTILALLPKIFYCFAIFTACMTSITSSSISLEGKSFDITKSLPISEKKILLSKILTSNLISIPFIIISDIIFFIAFRIEFIDIFCILAVSVILPTLTAIIGLIINLKYPKMNATSDTEIVKQSVSAMISVLIGMVLGAISIMAIITLSNKIKTEIIMIFEIVIYTLLTIILYKILNRYGIKRIKEINV